MKILFISSSNKSQDRDRPGAVVYNQGESLKQAGVSVGYFLVRNKGIWGYLRESRRLRRYLRGNPVDLIHAHYTLSGWTAVLAFARQPVVLSLMGTDAYGEYIGKDKILFRSRYLIWLTYLIQPFVRSIICKSKHIDSFVYLKHKSHIIPNGVFVDKPGIANFDRRHQLGLKQKGRYVLFIGDRRNPRKNFPLLKKAMDLMDSENVKLLAPSPISHDQVIRYLDSVDVLVVPSFMEGSPNIVKEAMVRNCPVVATAVGDVRWLFEGQPGHYITSFDPEDVAYKIRQALKYSERYGRTQGLSRILELGLDSESISKRIIGVYMEVLGKSGKEPVCSVKTSR